MPYFSSLAEDAGLRALFESNRHLARIHESFLALCDGSPLRPDVSQLIGAYVSALNASAFCFANHGPAAEALGVPRGLAKSLAADLEGAPASPKLKALLRYLRCVTKTPSRVSREEVAAALDAGWSEAEVRDALLMASFMCFINRIVAGSGISTTMEQGRHIGEKFAMRRRAAWRPKKETR